MTLHIFMIDAERLGNQFSDACRTLETILDQHNGAVPADNRQHDEAIVEATSIMAGSVGGLHRKIGDTHHVPYAENPYSQVCGEARAQLQAVLNKYPAQPVSLGTFHENLWVVLKSFRIPLDTKQVAPSAALPARVRPRTAPVTAAKRPLGRGRAGASTGSTQRRSGHGAIAAANFS